jgi:hypothetical protein
VKSSTSARSVVTVIDPTDMSQRSAHPPPVMAFHEGVTHSISTPSRVAISVATSMSKPSYSPVSSFSED